MKIFKVLLICLAVVVVLIGIALFVAMKTLQPEKIRVLAEQRISAALNRETTIKDLDFSLSLGAGLNFQAQDVVIKDLFSVESVQLRLDMKRFLTTKEIVIPQVVIDRPLIEWTSQTSQGLGAKEQPADGTVHETSAPQASGGEFPEVTIKEVRIRDGQFHFQDQLGDRPVDMTVRQLNVTIQDFGFNRSFPYTLSCAVFSGDLPLIDLKGKALISADSHQIRVSDVDLKILLKNLDLPELRRNFPEVDASGLQRLEDGTVRVQLTELDLDQQNMKNLKASVSLTDLAVQLKQLPSPLKINATLLASQSDVEVSQFTVGLREGAVSGRASVRDYAGQQNYSAELNLTGVQAADVIDFSEMDMKVRALLDGSITAQGQGFEPVALENRLGGQAKLRISAGSVLSAGDSSSGRPLNMSFKQVNLNISDFALNKFFPFTLTGTVFSEDQQVIDLKGRASIQTTGQQVRIQDGDLKVFLKKLDMVQLQQTLPELAQSGLERLDDGELRVQLSELLLDAKGLQKFKADGELVGVSLKVKQIPSMVHLTATVQADETNAELSGLTILIKEGAIKGRAAVRDYIGKQDFDTDVVLEAVQLADVVDLSELDLQIQGTMNGTFTARGTGFSAEAIEDNLFGQAVLKVADGKILNFNLLDYVMTQLPQALKIGGLQGLSSGLRADLSQRYPAQFEKEDTVFEVADVVVNVGGGHLKMDQTDFGTTEYKVQAQADLAFKGKLVLKSAMFITPEFSQRLIQKEKALEYLLDPTGQIRIPFKDYAGPVDKLGPPSLDLKNFTKQIFESTGKQELKNVLRKALDLDEPSAPVTTGTVQIDKTAPAQPAKQKPEDVLLDVFGGLLDKL